LQFILKKIGKSEAKRGLMSKVSLLSLFETVLKSILFAFTKHSFDYEMNASL